MHILYRDKTMFSKNSTERITMKKILSIMLIAAFLFCATHQTSISASASKADPTISGTVAGGYRILPIQKTTEKIHLKVFRGDYIKFKFNDTINNPSG